MQQIERADRSQFAISQNFQENTNPYLQNTNNQMYGNLQSPSSYPNNQAHIRTDASNARLNQNNVNPYGAS